MDMIDPPQSFTELATQVKRGREEEGGRLREKEEGGIERGGRERGKEGG